MACAAGAGTGTSTGGAGGETPVEGWGEGMTLSLFCLKFTAVFFSGGRTLYTS